MKYRHGKSPPAVPPVGGLPPTMGQDSHRLKGNNVPQLGDNTNR